MKMRKLLSMGLLSGVLVTSVTTPLTVGATGVAVNTGDVQIESEQLESLQNELGLLNVSSYKTGNVKDYIGKVGNLLYMTGGTKYMVIFTDENGTSINYTEEDGSVVEKFLTQEEAYVYIDKISVYNSVNKSINTFEKYSYLTNSTDIRTASKSSFYLFVESEGTPINIGYYANGEALEKAVETLDLSVKAPTVSLSQSSGKVVVNYEASQSGVSSIILRSESGAVLQNYTVEETKKASGTHTFEVGSNGTYTVECYVSEYVNASQLNTSKTITVTTGSSSDVEVGGTADTTAPTVKIGQLPSEVNRGIETQVKFTMNEPVTFSLNGKVSNAGITTYTTTVTENGSYTYIAVDAAGNKTEGVLEIDFFVEGVMDTSDRDGFWTNAASETTLPQTGALGVVLATLLGLGGAVTGGVLYKKSKSKQEDEAETEEVETEEVETEEVETEEVETEEVEVEEVETEEVEVEEVEVETVETVEVEEVEVETEEVEVEEVETEELETEQVEVEEVETEEVEIEEVETDQVEEANAEIQEDKKENTNM